MVRTYEAIKRAFDVLFSLILLILLSPLFVVIVVALKIRYRDIPPFFGVRLLGRNGREITVWKFSSMVRDAHMIIDDLLAGDPKLQEEWDRNIKLKNDPRILSGLGDFLRKTSLNELPQFFNVLIGDMSVVGPRPISKAEEQKYIDMGGEELLAMRHSIRPGITGLWQVSGRSDVDYRQRIELDRHYLEDRSLTLDIQIIVRTVSRVITRKGAY